MRYKAKQQKHASGDSCGEGTDRSGFTRGGSYHVKTRAPQHVSDYLHQSPRLVCSEAALPAPRGQESLYPGVHTELPP